MNPKAGLSVRMFPLIPLVLNRDSNKGVRESPIKDCLVEGGEHPNLSGFRGYRESASSMVRLHKGGTYCRKTMP